MIAWRPLQVAVMQKELTALQPQLIQTSAETEKMMVHIEKETAEVDAKKELVAADEKEANEAAAVAQGIKVILPHILMLGHFQNLPTIWEDEESEPRSRQEAATCCTRPVFPIGFSQTT